MTPLTAVGTAELSGSRNSKQMLSVYRKYKTQDKWNTTKLLSVVLLTEWKYLCLVHRWTQKEQQYCHICLFSGKAMQTEFYYFSKTALYLDSAEHKKWRINSNNTLTVKI